MSIKWIPMAEEWPPIGKRVLVYGPGNPEVGRFILTTDELHPGHERQGQGRQSGLYYWDGNDIFDDITHWAEVPPLPGEEAAGSPAAAGLDVVHANYQGRG